MRSKGVKVAELSDLMHDDELIRSPVATYTIAPRTAWTIRPAA
jgi:hypothetical protein